MCEKRKKNNQEEWKEKIRRDQKEAPIKSEKGEKTRGGPENRERSEGVARVGAQERSWERYGSFVRIFGLGAVHTWTECSLSGKIGGFFSYSEFPVSISAVPQ